MKRYLIIDTETTGLHPNNATIIEVGALLTDENYNVIDTYESYVNTSYVPPFITRLTGITTYDLKDAPSINQVMSELAQFAQNAIPVAHNAPFDRRFVRFYLEATNTLYEETEWIDTVKVFKEKFPGMVNYKLETLIKHFGLADKEDHRALSDAKHTLTLLKK